MLQWKESGGRALPKENGASFSFTPTAYIGIWQHIQTYCTHPVASLPTLGRSTLADALETILKHLSFFCSLSWNSFPYQSSSYVFSFSNLHPHHSATCIPSIQILYLSDSYHALLCVYSAIPSPHSPQCQSGGASEGSKSWCPWAVPHEPAPHPAHTHEIRVM